jgi:hypothetical protein
MISSSGLVILQCPLPRNRHLTTVQDPKPYSLFLYGLAKQAQEVPAAELSDLIRGEASF